MADAQHMHASKMARGESEYQGKLLEARQSDWKGRVRFARINGADIGDRLGSLFRRPWSSRKDKNVL